MKKSIKNIFFGILGQVITIALGIVLPKLFIFSYGSEVNGMLSSVNNIFSYIALLEAGVGTATLQALYGPVANNHYSNINSILAATDRFYKRVGFLYLIAILVFAGVYPFCVQSEIDHIVIVLVILFIGLSNVINFFFQGKYKLLLQAEGKQYIITNVTTVIHTFVSISKIVLIFAGFSVVAITLAQFVLNIVQMIYYTVYIKRHYKWLDLKVKPDKESISQSKNVIVHQVSLLIFNNTDAIVLSVFCGFKAASIYALYNLLFEMVSTLLSNVQSGFVYKMGQLCNSDREAFKKYYEPWELFTITISFAMYCITYIFITPFISLYTAGADINYVDFWLPVLFVIIKIMVSGRGTSGYAASFAGHFKQTQWRSVIEMVINIAVSLVAVIFIDIYGVLVGTIAALLYRSNDMIIYNSRHIIMRSPWITYKRWLTGIAVFVATAYLAELIPMNTSTYLSLILWCIPVAICVVALFFVSALVTDLKTSKLMFTMAKDIFRKKKQ